MFTFTNVLFALGGLVGIAALTTFFAMLFRRVVSTNEVHIVQSARSTISYGKDSANGNSYYEWPSWVPFFGVVKSTLPTSVFDLDLAGYDAYDKGRLPFTVDVKAFFRIADSNVAAQRVASFDELHNQLKAIVQGAVRSILASNEIEEILQGRSTFGDQFTKEVTGQLANWGVETVKNIELMDLRDGKDSKVIHNIMEKKKSHIEMESRVEVAKNQRLAQISETEAKRDVDMQKQEAVQAVGMRQVESNRKVEIATQEAAQAVKELERATREKEMSVIRVTSLRTAEIEKDVQVVKANQARETSVIAAETSQQTAVVIAEGALQAKKRESEAILAEGSARAGAEKAMQLAPVEAQIVLAKEIGGNESYQKYLITIEQIKAGQAVGIEQAKALEKADVKIISNSGSPTSGLKSAMDVFSSQGGTQLGAMLEGLAASDAGKALVTKFLGAPSTKDN